MIFYFTGTGNSKFIADKIGVCLGEKTVDIGEASKNNEYTYDCSEEQIIGFVFPTYGFCMPSIVSEFIANMELDNLSEDAYVFAVNNCGGSQGRALYDLDKKLKDKNITLSYCRSVVFPDNYIVMYNAPEDEELRRILRSANIRLANIINNILRNKKSLELKKGIMLPIYKAFNFVFVKLLNGTSKFRVENECVGCGLCAEICNSNAIEIQDGKPVWVNKNCVHCLACINRCPKGAIEYGNKTKDKARYVNPLVRFNKNADIEEADTKENDFETEPEYEVTDNSQVNEIIGDVVKNESFDNNDEDLKDDDFVFAENEESEETVKEDNTEE